jgi:asparagine synthase (glutamine-hydrolysing)
LDEPPAGFSTQDLINGGSYKDPEIGLILVERAVREEGAAAPERLIGDFAFAVYEPARGVLVAARDPFGVKTLYYAEHAHHVLVASHASLLAGGGYEEDFIATFLLGNVAPTAHTMYAGVARVPPGGVVLAVPEGELLVTRYWTPHPSADAPQQLSDAAACFRQRFTSCVRTRIAADVPTWSELSGGTDSSSVVVTADHLARTGGAPPLDGAITHVDSLGEGDELSFARAVIAQVGLRLIIIRDDWPWRDDGEPPPVADEPSPFYPFFARDRRCVRAVRHAGGRVLLSGLGADHYLSGSPVWLADLVARGRLGRAVRASAAIAVAYRTSMWRVARRYAFQPLLPAALRYRFAPAADRVPSWVSNTYARRHDMRRRLALVRVGREGMTSRFHDEIAIELGAVQNAIPRTVFDEAVDLRFPFLDRRLIELALGVPRECIQGPRLGKVILREAMRGRLADVVRLRSTKGGIDARILWALVHERARIDALLREPCLADIGAIDPVQLRRAVDDARKGHVVNTAFLLSALALETWLAVRDGRWRVQQQVQAETHSDAALTCFTSSSQGDGTPVATRRTIL